MGAGLYAGSLGVSGSLAACKCVSGPAGIVGSRGVFGNQIPLTPVRLKPSFI